MRSVTPRSIVAELGDQRFDLAVGHVLGLDMHHVAFSQRRAEGFELPSQIVGMLSGEAWKDTRTFAMFAMTEGSACTPPAC